jgi:hypothetical protein
MDWFDQLSPSEQSRSIQELLDRKKSERTPTSPPPASSKRPLGSPETPFKGGSRKVDLYACDSC